MHGSQSSAIISTEKSPRVRFSDGNSDLSRKPSFMDAESSGKKNAGRCAICTAIHMIYSSMCV